MDLILSDPTKLCSVNDISICSAHGSNPLFYPNIWSGTCAEQHMNKSIDENDDTQNVIYEHENGQAIPKYDPTGMSA